MLLSIPSIYPGACILDDIVLRLALFHMHHSLALALFSCPSFTTFFASRAAVLLPRAAASAAAVFLFVLLLRQNKKTCTAAAGVLRLGLVGKPYDCSQQPCMDQ